MNVHYHDWHLANVNYPIFHGRDPMVNYSSLYLPLHFYTCLCVLFRDTVFATFCYMCSCTYSGIIINITRNTYVLPYKLLKVASVSNLFLYINIAFAC